MAYKNILVYLDHSNSNAERVKTAIAMAKAHGAKLTGVGVLALPTNSMLQRLGLGPNDSLVRDSRARLKEVIKAFGDATDAEGLDYDSRLLECNEGRMAEKLARLARNFDLSIMRQANPDRANAALVHEVSEEVLFSSGRPVFFMPYIGAHRIPCRSGMIAWNGSASAARAVNDAIPMLAGMEEVIVLIVDGDRMERNTEAMPGEEISAHLSRHGVNNKIVRVPSGGAPTSTIIQNEISDRGIDILIMGGYGTPKLREMVWGGVTRTLFSSMIVPVFMSH